MKFVVTMKDPDTLDDAIREAVAEEDTPGLDAKERAAVLELRVEKARDLCRKWFRYGEGRKGCPAQVQA